MAEINELNHASLAVNYELDDDFDSDKFIKMRLRVCHDGTNPNGSHFELSDMKTAENTLKNIPILANVIFDENDQPQFGGHDISIEKDKVKEGEYKTIYKEVPIGVIPETNNYSIDEYDGRNYVFVDGYVWRGYSNYAEDIIERDKDIKLSMEISVDEFSYNAKNKVYNITGYKYTGITFLNNEFGTGMRKAMGTTGTFSDNTEQMLMIMQELKDALATFNKKNTEEGGMTMDMENVTNGSTDSTASAPETPTVNEKSIDNPVPETPADQTVTKQDNEPTEYVRTFKLSHEDIRCGLYTLLEQREIDANDWYYIESVYDGYFDYSSYIENKVMRQNYNLNGDSVEFTGEPFEVFKETLTASEKTALDAMRNNYSAMEAELAELRTYKDNAEKNILNAKRDEVITKWSEQLKNNEQFEALKSEVEKYSVEELEIKCKCIFADSKAVFNFSAKTPTKDDGVVRVPVSYDVLKTMNDPYGGLFNEFGIKKD